MLRARIWTAVALGMAWSTALSGCSGKTERGGSGASGDSTPVQQPAAAPANPQPTRAEPARHLLMVVELEPATHAARTLTARSVELPLPRRRGTARKGPWRVDVLDASGAVLFSAPLEDAATVRGEFADAQGQLSGVSAQKRVAAVTLRLPWLDGASEVRVVRLSNGADSELGRVAYPAVAP
ncbi:MAG: hypothetical protein ABUL60_00255 [Myxococcales bacterium]